ncbi:MAG: tetratricopeptide repeat protein, partial [Myxococcota bacterium]
MATGNRLASEKKPAEAIAAYDRALARQKDDPTVLFDRGTSRAEGGDLDGAASDLRAASQSAALRGPAFYNLGNALMAKEKWSEAAEAYRQSLMASAGDRRAKWNLEVALRKLEEKKKKQEQKEKDQQQQKEQQQDQPQKDEQQQQQQQHQQQ